MKFKAKVTGCAANFEARALDVSLRTIDCNITNTLAEMPDAEKVVDVTIKEHREKRSLDANAYYWVLIAKLAKKIQTSNAEAHNIMLARYGTPEVVDGNLIRASLPETIEAERMVRTSEEYHLKATSQVLQGNDGKNYRTYILIKGSSRYNTEEMARLIDGLISECREVGIPESEIATPDQRAELEERYGVKL